MGKRLVTLAAILALVSVLTSSAAANVRFTDPPLDQTGPEGLGPDITEVHVSSAPDGLITFRVSIANYQTLPVTAFVAIFFDLDRNPATGGEGDEARVGWVPDFGMTFERWNGSDFVAAPGDALAAGFANGVFTLAIPRSELNGVENFDFLVGAMAIADSQLGIDLAPGLDRRWRYDVVPSLLTLTPSKLAVTPKRPVAGKQFSVSLVVTRSDTGATLRTGSVRCAVRVGNAPLRAGGSFRGQRAGCTMKIPRTATGKRLTGSLTVRVAGAVVTKRFAFRVA